jgi:hypothetical protein
MNYLYETHLHTALASACAVSEGPDYLKIYQDRGYAGIIVTDHFYNGNSALPRSLPWREWVNHFCRGYEETKEAGDRIGFDVFFGWEETFDGCDDYLVYGLDKAWLLEHPEVKRWTRLEQYRAVKAAGGCVVQAHPFRQHSYIRKVILSAGCVDAVEAANAGNYEQSYDALALRYAQKLGLPVTAGSDMHGAAQTRGFFGVYLSKKMKTIADYAAAICRNEIAGLETGEGRCDFHGNERVSLPVEIRDRNDRITGKKWQDVIF